MARAAPAAGRRARGLGRRGRGWWLAPRAAAAPRALAGAAGPSPGRTDGKLRHGSKAVASANPASPGATLRSLAGSGFGAGCGLSGSVSARMNGDPWSSQ